MAGSGALLAEADRLAVRGFAVRVAVRLVARTTGDGDGARHATRQFRTNPSTRGPASRDPDAILRTSVQAPAHRLGRNPRRTLIRIAVLTVLSFIMFGWLLTPVRVRGISMEPTYHDSER